MKRTPMAKCSGIYGNTTVAEHLPACIEVFDALYVPSGDAESPAGVFDIGRKRIYLGSYFQGPIPSIAAAGFATTYDPMQIETAPDESYIYGGYIHDHFGHFLLSTFSRLWSLESMPNIKVLFHAGCTIQEIYEKGFVKDLMSAVGLDESRALIFDSCVRIKKLIVPGSSFEELNYVHRAYQSLGNRVGKSLTRDIDIKTNDRPIYFSKERLVRGVRKTVNEADITSVLAAEGVEIIYPEALTIREQAQIWWSRPYICGFSGSAMHANILAPGGNEVFSIHDSHVVNSSYVLGDRVNGTNAHYFGLAKGESEELGQADGMISTMAVKRPKDIAECLLRAIEFRRSNRNILDQSLPLISKNVALHKPTRQSSCHPWVDAAAPNATSGQLTGTFQFHTDHEMEPWWEVDLGADMPVIRIDLYNRCDDGAERACDIEITATSSDDLTERPIHSTGSTVFGGLFGDRFSYVLEKPCHVRFIKLKKIGPDYLHLDQVAVYC